LGIQLRGLAVGSADNVSVLEQAPRCTYREGVLLALLERGVIRLQHLEELGQWLLGLAKLWVPFWPLPQPPPFTLEDNALGAFGALLVLSVPGTGRDRSLLTLRSLLIEPLRTQEAVGLRAWVTKDRFTNRAVPAVAVGDAAA